MLAQRGPAQMFADPFTSALREPDLFEKLAAFPDVRKHLADPGFTEQLEKLRALATDPALEGADIMKTAEVGQKIAQAGHRDPRVMQALMALQGQGLIVDEKDLKRAEDFGDMKRREPVQLREMQMVRDLQDPDEAKAKGNEHFKAGDYSAALAHYEKGVELLRSQKQVPAAAIATLLSNAAMCLLKLKWPDRAKKSASMAIAVVRQAEDGSFDQSKLFYRRALACEQLKDFSMAVDDMARALQQAKKADLILAEQHRLKGEVDRLKKLKASAEESSAKRKKEQENERLAEVQRLQGERLKAKTPVAGPATTVPSTDYLTEQDFTHWTKRQLEQVLKGITHRGDSGAVLETVELQESNSKIQASITNKKGSRALYYEMDLHVTWKGRAAEKLAPADGPRELSGLIRVYNIAHDTKFELGGDENTSYIYALGWDQRMSGPWVEDLRTEAAELFDLIATKVDGVIAALKKK